MNIEINTIDELLTFVKRKEVSQKDAISVFERAFNVTCIMFVDAITRELTTNKETVINTIEEYVRKVREDKVYNKIVLFTSNS
jgi:hypothetical protein